MTRYYRIKKTQINNLQEGELLTEIDEETLLGSGGRFDKKSLLGWDLLEEVVISKK